MGKKTTLAIIARLFLSLASICSSMGIIFAIDGSQGIFSIIIPFIIALTCGFTAFKLNKLSIKKIEKDRK